MELRVPVAQADHLVLREQVELLVQAGHRVLLGLAVLRDQVELLVRVELVEPQEHRELMVRRELVDHLVLLELVEMMVQTAADGYLI
jgi:hypothetical protein